MLRKQLLSIILLTSLIIAEDIPSDNQIQGRLNIVNGYSTECVMHRFYTNSGWVKIEGEVGRNGIDGLYYKKKHGVIREVLVAESKWNKSKLGRSGKNKLLSKCHRNGFYVLYKGFKSINPYPSITPYKNSFRMVSIELDYSK